ncbi:MAG TPA: hypothetical protein VHF58_06665 [Solirubrobacterales bacterium]|nr:hypothetical protein [Solirubrobacterales bacterium]
MHRNLSTLIRSLSLCALVLAALAPGAAAQKGVLGTGTSPSTGITDEKSGFRYSALPAHDGTMLAKIDMATGEVERFRFFDEQLAVPSVAYDGSPGGLSADGETLVLSRIGVRFPQVESEFTVIDTRRLAPVDDLVFAGTYTFDALSPDGGSLFLIEYTHPRDLTEYVVREYDLVRDRFNPEPIIDPNESAEEMYGSPVTRVASPDGRWEYTLYDGREHPFIHALDTQKGEAVCIDLETLHRPVYGGTELEVSPDGSTLTVANGRRPIELVDTRTFEVAPAPAGESAADRTAPAPAEGAPADDGSALGWIVLTGGLGLLAVAVAMLTRRRRRKPTGEDELERLVGVGRGGATDAPAEEERERDPVG